MRAVEACNIQVLDRWVSESDAAADLCPLPMSGKHEYVINIHPLIIALYAKLYLYFVVNCTSPLLSVMSFISGFKIKWRPLDCEVS